MLPLMISERQWPIITQHLVSFSARDFCIGHTFLLGFSFLFVLAALNVNSSQLFLISQKKKKLIKKKILNEVKNCELF